MRKGDIVKFKVIIEAGDDKARMRLLEDPDGGRVLLESLMGMNINPTCRYNVDDLELCGNENNETK